MCCGSVLGLSRLRSILREERVPRGRQCVSQERTRSAKKAFRTVTADNTWFSSHCLRLLLVFVCSVTRTKSCVVDVLMDIWFLPGIESE